MSAKPLIDCPFCEEIAHEVALALKHCPRCHRPLGDRVGGPLPVSTSSTLVAHPVEQRYSKAPLVIFEDGIDLVEYSSHALLEYGATLLKVLGAYLDFAENGSELPHLLGFLTGSEALTWPVRRMLGGALDGRLRHTRGLAHKGGGLHNPDDELKTILDEWTAIGMRRLAVVDELVSGTQLRTALLRITSWARQSQPVDLPLELRLLAVMEPNGINPEERFQADVLKNDLPDTSAPVKLTWRLIEGPLLAKDKRGRPIKGVRKDRDGEYQPWREWIQKVTATCPNATGLQPVPSLDIRPTGSVDQVFGEVMMRIFGMSRANGRWPDGLEDGDCRECASLLSAARRLGMELKERLDGLKRARRIREEG